MYFKRLEMHGFKSFADPVVIDFHDGITCIVGPNGSGKSNISDAIRWVLGEQSPKALRGGKMEEVIFAGTASRKSRGMAEVVLVIDNSSGILDIDYNEVAITRRMYRSGESEYLINNNPCRLRDIRELIMDTGIGVDGYSIIGQGKIADIVSTKPEARREIFEEAAGVVLYKTRRGEAEKKLASTSSNLERVDDIIAEIDSRIGKLREDSIKAKEYLSLKETYDDLEVNIILRNIETAEEAANAFREDMDRLTAEIAELETRRASVLEETRRISERREIVEKLTGETRDQILAAVQKINEITGRSKISEERLAGIEKETGIITADIQGLEERLEGERESRVQLDAEALSMEREENAARKALDEAIARYEQAAARQADIAAGADEGRRKLFDLHSELARCESDISGFENLKESLLKRRAELTELTAQTEARIESYKAVLNEKKEKLEQEQQALSADKAKLQDLIRKNNEAAARSRSLSESVARDRLELSRLASRRKTMEEMESNYEGYNYGVRSLMKADLPGILGVAADLMTVPEGFETAIETAMGAAMQNVICETDADAKRGVNFLKHNKAGRLTFLPVASIRRQQGKGAESFREDPGFIDMAVDLISCEDKLDGVYRYLLGRTAVVKDMDAAIRLSKKGGGNRFVTLEGEVVSAAGAITGGAYKNKTANLLERKAEIHKLGEEIAALEQGIRTSEGELERAGSEMEEIGASLTLVQSKIRQAEIAIGILGSDVTAAEDHFRKEEEDAGRFHGELNDIGREVADLDETIAARHTSIDACNEGIRKLNEEIEGSLDQEDTAKQATQAMNDEVTSARIALNEVQTRVEAHQRLIDRVNDQAQAYKAAIAAKKESLNELEFQREEILRGSQETVKLSDVVRRRSELENSLRRLSDEKETLLEQHKAIEQGQASVLEKLNDLRDEKYRIEIRSAKGETQLETLKEKLWEEFEITYAQAADRRNEDFVYSRAVKETREIRSRMKELGDVNVGAIAEYEQVSERYEFLTAQREDILKAKDELSSIISDMDRTIKTRFKENFDKVVKNFEEIFQELFGGGQAELRLDNEDDPLNAGIDIVAQPPGKKLQNINLMSGGEKTMTAIALMFAVLKTKPTPFCILDEVEAALDDTNIDRFANYLRKFDDIQFALVTHQKATMEHADVLYGVTMPEHGISKVLSLRLGDDFEL
ncbi:MAG: chromosome segregation protein SMC [Eubacterium sp.]|nr:chromosome segregation protein SMC [Eubacterium sp.]